MKDLLHYVCIPFTRKSEAAILLQRLWKQGWNGVVISSAMGGPISQLYEQALVERSIARRVQYAIDHLERGNTDDALRLLAGVIGTLEDEGGDAG